MNRINIDDNLTKWYYMTVIFASQGSNTEILEYRADVMFSVIIKDPDILSFSLSLSTSKVHNPILRKFVFFSLRVASATSLNQLGLSSSHASLWK